MKTPEVTLKAFQTWMKAFMQPRQEERGPLTEVDDGDGTYRAVDKAGHTVMIYGDGFRTAVQKHYANSCSQKP